MKTVSILFLHAFFTAYCFSQSLVNTAHLDNLYEEIKIQNDTIGIIHVKSAYPDYKWISSTSGKACIDDASRALVFYLRYHKFSGDEKSLDKVRKLLKFIFMMHSENGMFYNYLLDDNKINNTSENSKAIPEWWTWRALWALSESAAFYKDKDPQLFAKIHNHVFAILEAPVEQEISAEQAALLLKALTIFYETTKEEALLPAMKKLGKYIVQNQTGEPFYILLTGKDKWSSFNNIQAEVLISAGKVLKDTSFINSALKEIRNFYPYLDLKSYYSALSVDKKGEEFVVAKVEPFPQTAATFSNLIMNAAAAYEFTGDEFFIDIASSTACWFFSCNLADIVYYSPKTGICFDAFLDGEVDKNSSAGSVIEALLCMLRIETIPELKLQVYYKVNGA